jgi:hypothetical protein
MLVPLNARLEAMNSVATMEDAESDLVNSIDENEDDTL